MQDSLDKLLNGYQDFRKKYALGDASVMHHLSEYGQNPDFMVVACSDSRVDPALILQCKPGDLFVARNVANIIPQFVKDNSHHGTSAALEYGICFLNVKHLIILGHSQCGGIQALLHHENMKKNDFIENWVSIMKQDDFHPSTPDDYAKFVIKQSYKNSLTFPWIKEKVDNGDLLVHLWFFDINSGQIFAYNENEDEFKQLK